MKPLCLPCASRLGKVREHLILPSQVHACSCCFQSFTVTPDHKWGYPLRQPAGNELPAQSATLSSPGAY